MNYFVYIKDVLALATNEDSFSWSYGTKAPKATREEFEKAKVKVFLDIVPDRLVPENHGDKFSFFTADKEEKSIYYSRRLPGGIKLCYNLKIDGCRVYMTCGKNYKRFIRGRFMNIHSAGYTLTDVVEGLLLKMGLGTLYCASVSLDKERCLCIFGAPNTGKTLTALSLCAKGGRLISEDFALTDGETIYGAPYTHTHRRYNIEGLKEDVEILLEPRRITDIAIIGKGSELVQTDKDKIKLKCLNRYGLGYKKSPLLTVMSYFFGDYDINSMEKTEEELLEKLIENCGFVSVKAENPVRFADMIMNNI